MAGAGAVCKGPKYFDAKASLMTYIFARTMCTFVCIFACIVYVCVCVYVSKEIDIDRYREKEREVCACDNQMRVGRPNGKWTSQFKRPL